jgi:hypothetical protein
MATENHLGSDPGGEHGDEASRVTIGRPMQISIRGKDHERDDKL